MAFKVQIPIGESLVTVRGLYQWDYGQNLEIECSEIGSEIMEIHFAYPSISEAIVRACTFANGIGTVLIPDECLEQTGVITAWLYKVDGTQGHTIKTISLPINPRTRPSIDRTIPSEYVDKYGQLIEEVNEAIDAIENGNVTAAKALLANTATSATTAGSANSATYATSAGSANTATSAAHASSADRLSYTETMIENVTTAGYTVNFEYGQAYLISALLANQGNNQRETFLLYIAEKKPEGAMAGKYVHSTRSANNFCVYWLNSKIFFQDGNGNLTTAKIVTIREL